MKVIVTCAKCGRDFEREKRYIRMLQKKFFCNRTCSADYLRELSKRWMSKGTVANS